MALSIASLSHSEVPALVPEVLPDLGALPALYNACAATVKTELQALPAAASITRIAANQDALRPLPDLAAFCADHVQRNLTQLPKAARADALDLAQALRPPLLQ